MKLCVIIVLVFCFNYGLSLTNKRSTSHTRPNDVAHAATFYDKRNEILTIPITIHLDRATIIKNPVLNKHRKKKTLKTVFKSIFKEVEQFYKRPSLNLTINIKLIDVRILKKVNTKIQTGDVSRYLGSYCRWQGEMKTREKMQWYSILFTGLDLFYKNGYGNEVRNSAGRGYMKGICSVNNSCTLLEWHPNHMAYVLAHEMAHSLGISHDGPPHNDCKDQRYIMDAVYDHHNPAKNWSSCSRRTLRQFLMSPRAWCLWPERRN